MTERQGRLFHKMQRGTAESNGLEIIATALPKSHAGFTFG
jgi:hypothetical protein